MHGTHRRSRAKRSSCQLLLLSFQQYPGCKDCSCLHPNLPNLVYLSTATSFSMSLRVRTRAPKQVINNICGLHRLDYGFDNMLEGIIDVNTGGVQTREQYIKSEFAVVLYHGIKVSLHHSSLSAICAILADMCVCSMPQITFKGLHAIRTFTGFPSPALFCCVI